jgi:hypothetical protein
VCSRRIPACFPPTFLDGPYPEALNPEMIRAPDVAPATVWIAPACLEFKGPRTRSRIESARGTLAGDGALPQGNRGYAGKRTRTSDPRITNALLYQLSYPGPGHAENRAFYIFLRSRITRSMPATSVPGGGWGRRLNSTAGTGTSISAPLSRS